MVRARSHWAWGWADRLPDEDARRDRATQLSALFGGVPLAVAPLPRIEDVVLPPARIDPPAALAGIVSADRLERLTHAHGRGYRDLIRGFIGDFHNAPDLVASPRTEADVGRVLDFCGGAGIAVIPFGGGTSVTGGVEAEGVDRARPVLALDTRALGRLLDYDPRSLHATIEAGATGPELEAQLAVHGVTLRHFPQSFEHSTLGGWIATRAGGHFATLQTHIDDLVAAVRMVTPAGLLDTTPRPASGAGPEPERLVLGSEGILGVITRATVRVQPRPRFRARASVTFARFEDGIEAVRAIAQSGLHPANCRLLDEREAALFAVNGQGESVLLLAFESADHPLEPWMTRALELARDHGATGVEATAEGAGAGVDEAWRKAFFDAPYLQSALVTVGVMADTFETACTWQAFPALHADVIGSVRAAMKRTAGAGWISCRLTHVYPDGPAPYYTFLTPARRGAELEQWAELKAAASEALLRHRATITHHHAVGRVHRPWYERECPPPFALALRAAKQALDPAGIMNPGVLLPA